MRKVVTRPLVPLFEREELDELALVTIREGSAVKVANTPGHRDGFSGTVMGIHKYPDGHIEVDVCGDKRGGKSWRTYAPERLQATETEDSK